MIGRTGEWQKRHLKALPHVTISSTMDFNVAKIASARASSTISLRVAGPLNGTRSAGSMLMHQRPTRAGGRTLPDGARPHLAAIQFRSRRVRSLRPCPHDTFPNWARSIATSSRPVARVHTGANGTLVPDPRDHLSTWNDWARSIAIGRAQSSLSCGRSSGR